MLMNTLSRKERLSLLLFIFAVIISSIIISDWGHFKDGLFFG